MKIFLKIQNLQIFLIKLPQFQSQTISNFGLSTDGFRFTESKLHGMKLMNNAHGNMGQLTEQLMLRHVRTQH